MYHAHFALQEEPFGASPDQRFFLPTEQHRRALAALYYGVEERRGFALLIGSAGLGKTSVLVKLMQALKEKAQIVYLPHPYFDRRTVLEAILHALNEESSPSMAENFRRLQDHLIRTNESGKTCVVVFDEAHALPLETLEAIRMLSNAGTGSQKLIQIILAGQTSLADMLQMPELEQLRQRCNVIARLQPLSRREVGDYLAFRLKIAGAEGNVFTAEAEEAIAVASAGIPRNVNTLSANALALAFTANHEQVGAGEVDEVVRELNLTTDSGELAQIVAPDRAADQPRDMAMIRYSTEKLLPEGSTRLKFVTEFLSVRSNLLAVVAASLFLLLSWFTGMVITDYR